ncbi:MAG TPA: helix-turn-helix transcriptional regulator [Ktedonobacterales bacterium]
MHKILLLLGLLRYGPMSGKDLHRMVQVHGALSFAMSGYDLHNMVRTHGALSTDLKKGNVYYLLDRLAADGYLHVRTESGARGPRGERLIYSLTSAGCERFEELLREVLRTYDPIHSGVDVAIIFLKQMPHAEALALLEERRQSTALRRQQVASELDEQTRNSPLQRIAFDHLLSLIDAELAWLDRTLANLRVHGWERKPGHSDTLPAHSSLSDTN